MLPIKGHIVVLAAVVVVVVVVERNQINGQISIFLEYLKQSGMFTLSRQRNRF